MRGHLGPLAGFVPSPRKTQVFPEKDGKAWAKKALSNYYTAAREAETGLGLYRRYCLAAFRAAENKIAAAGASHHLQVSDEYIERFVLAAMLAWSAEFHY